LKITLNYAYNSHNLKMVYAITEEIK